MIVSISLQCLFGNVQSRKKCSNILLLVRREYIDPAVEKSSKHVRNAVLFLILMLDPIYGDNCNTKDHNINLLRKWIWLLSGSGLVRLLLSVFYGLKLRSNVSRNSHLPLCPKNALFQLLLITHDKDNDLIFIIRRKQLHTHVIYLQR